MSPFWSYKKIPEIAALPKSEQLKTWKAILKDLNKHPNVKVAQIAYFIIVSLAVTIATQLPYTFQIQNKVLIATIGGALGGYIGSTIYVSSIRKHMQPYIDQHFETHPSA